MKNNKRILVVDDQPDLRGILGEFITRSGQQNSTTSLVDQMKSRIAGRADLEKQSLLDEPYTVDTAGQGEEAYDLVKKSLDENNPYSVIFLDMRMPPGWDGLKTMEAILSIAPYTQIVICTAYSDYTWEEIVERVGKLDNLLILKKPFDTVEVSQLALALTEKYNSELKLRYANHYLDQIFLSMNSILISTTPTGIITHWNAAAENFTGLKQDDAVQKVIWDILPFASKLRTPFEQVLENNSSSEIRKLEFNVGDNTKYFDIFINPLNATNSLIDDIVLRIDDVTLSVKKDDHLRQSQKMDSIGNLAAGLAHDFKNIVGGIDGTISLIKYCIEMESDIDTLKDDISNSINIIQESASRGMDMVEQLLSLSRKKEQPFSPVNMNELVKHVLKIGKNSFGNEIVVKTNYSTKNAMIMAYPTQMEQVILNLCINASHAMTIMRDDENYSGTLTISIDEIKLSEDIAHSIPQAVAGNYWLLSISDTGIGMDKKTADNIFDPFFTTKENDKGTGLGLAMAYNIISQHNGFIEVNSKKGVGTTFTVFLPALKDN